MIIETLVTTQNTDGSVNIAPMGPTFQGSWDRFELRPFDTSKTLANLQRTGEGILHITDNAWMMALAAIGCLQPLPDLVAGEQVEVMAIRDACRWYEFKVDFIETSALRSNIGCRTVHRHQQREFVGFNRAKHAVIEAAILATRVDFLPREEIVVQYRHLRTIVDKTGSAAERKGMDVLENFVFSKEPCSPNTES